MTGAGRAVLKGEAPLTLRGELPLPGGRKADLRRTLAEIEALRTEDPAPPREAFTPVKQSCETAPLTANQNRLLARLKAKRLEVARQQKQPAFIIFHDRVLIEMAQIRPETHEDMQAIPGIGPEKLARYGSIFLAVIANCGGDL